MNQSRSCDMVLYMDKPFVTHSQLLEEVLTTTLIIVLFLAAKAIYDRIRQNWAKIRVLVIGAGPVGLTAAVIAARSEKVSSVHLFEEKTKSCLISRPQQIALEERSVQYLQHLGVDFDNIEGCWQKHSFFTRIGVFQEYLLSLLDRFNNKVVVKLNTKFNRDIAKTYLVSPDRLLIIVCDGIQGTAGTIVGLSDEFLQDSCKLNGAMATIERPDQRQVPTPEIRVHDITFDLSAYGGDYALNDPRPRPFHMKIFGTFRNRYVSISVPKCDSLLVRSLRLVMDPSIIRNIFQEAFNKYKMEGESAMSDAAAVNDLRFTPRLFEVKLFHRLENAVYVEDIDMFVTAEGDASRFLNFNSGMDVNFGMSGLESLNQFITMAAMADSQNEILKALMVKTAHAQQITTDAISHRLQRFLFE